MLRPMYPKLPFQFVIAVASLGLAHAQELRVDLNASGRPLTETWDPAYAPWSTNASWFPGGDVISSTFNGVTFTFQRVGPTGTSLRTDRYPAGLTTAGWNAKLVSARNPG